MPNCIPAPGGSSDTLRLVEQADFNRGVASLEVPVDELGHGFEEAAENPELMWLEVALEPQLDVRYAVALLDDA